MRTECREKESRAIESVCVLCSIQLILATSLDYMCSISIVKENTSSIVVPDWLAS